MSPQTRTITSRGIATFGMHYWSPQLSGLERVGINGKKVQFGFSYDVNDISKISLFRDGVWVGDAFAKELRLPNGETQILSLTEREMAQDIARIKGYPINSWIGFIDQIEELKDIREREKNMVNKSRKKGRPRKNPITVSVSSIENNLNQISKETNQDDEITQMLIKFSGNNRNQ